MLKGLFPGYVRRMKAKIKGDAADCPVEVIDSRDLKHFVNVAGCWFEPEDDRFAWRGRLGLARAGFAEMVVFGGLFLILAVLCVWPLGWPWLAAIPLGFAAFVVSFFRDPERAIPGDAGTVISPADGKLVDIVHLPHDPLVGGPAVKFGIFLSVFNVHINRASLAGRVESLDYQPGKFLNALLARSAEENERLTVVLAEPGPMARRLVIKQIAGAIARRIVCELRPGQVVARGGRFGMIKFGSRTELIIPADGLEIVAKLGQTVRGGSTWLGRYPAWGAGGES